jgi:hypothetical protein
MDLSKRDTPLRSRPRRTAQRETTLPRPDTDGPQLEVNAVIRRPETASNAEALAKLLGVAEDATSNIVGDIKAKRNAADSAQAAFDFAEGDQNPDKFKKSRAYYKAWQLEGSKALAVDIEQSAHEAALTALNSDDASIDDVDAAIERVFVSRTHDERGNLLDFGTPEAKATLGRALADTKAKLVGFAHAEIKARQDSKLLFTRYDNLAVERERGSPLGTPLANLPDPLAPLPDSPDKTDKPRDPLAPLLPGWPARPAIVTGTEPGLSAPPPRPSATRGGYPVNEFLEGLPPSVSRDEAKTWLVDMLLADATKTHDATALEGIEEARRSDGTPWFSPVEAIRIIKARTDLEGHIEKHQREAKARLFDENEDRVLQSSLEGNPPSTGWLAEQASKGLLPERFVYSMAAHNEAMARQQRVEANAEARADQAQADSETNMAVQSRAVELEAGDPEALGSTTEDQLSEQWNAGDFGPLGSKASMARYRTLRTALHQGQKLTEQNPYYAKGMALLQKYKPVSKRGGPPLLLAPNSGRLDAGTYTEMINRYRELVHQGKDPGEAYTVVVDKYVRGQSKAAQAYPHSATNRLAYLKCKRAGRCT